MFNLGDVGEYRFDNYLSGKGDGKITSISSKYLFVSFDNITDKPYTVVFNADGTGTSRGPKDNTLGNGLPYPKGVDDGTDIGSTFVVTKPARGVGANSASVSTDQELAEEGRKAYTRVLEITSILQSRGYIVNVKFQRFTVTKTISTVINL